MRREGSLTGTSLNASTLSDAAASKTMGPQAGDGPLIVADSHL
jgi:hypothetical protein